VEAAPTGGACVRLAPAGRLAEACWRALPTHAPHVTPDAFVVMPDHLHGLVLFHAAPEAAPAAVPDAMPEAPRPTPAPHAGRRFGQPQAGSLSTLMRSYKAAVIRYKAAVIRAARPPARLRWQRSFHDRVVRDADELARIRHYIQANPAAWLARYGPG
jgi:REP element-mobilizing transposase RayT